MLEELNRSVAFGPNSATPNDNLFLLFFSSCGDIFKPHQSGYDGGDCCSCTCVDTVHYRCGSEHHGGFACLDPGAPCVDDDDVTALPHAEYTSYSGRPSSLCFESGISDGDCDPSNNNEDCRESSCNTVYCSGVFKTVCRQFQMFFIQFIFCGSGRYVHVCVLKVGVAPNVPEALRLRSSPHLNEKITLREHLRPQPGKQKPDGRKYTPTMKLLYTIRQREPNDTWKFLDRGAPSVRDIFPPKIHTHSCSGTRFCSFGLFFLFVDAGGVARL